MEQIRHFFEQRFKLTQEDWAFFASKLFRQEFDKSELLLKVGSTENYLSFIKSGSIRFYFPKVENDLTFAFGFQNNFVSAYDSFLTRTASTYQVETLTPTILWRLHHVDLQSIYENTSIGNRIGRWAGEELYLRKSKRELSLLNDTPEKRYLNLFSEEPELIKSIPLKYIASYIGVTPQALSRIRKRIT